MKRKKKKKYQVEGSEFKDFFSKTEEQSLDFIEYGQVTPSEMANIADFDGRNRIIYQGDTMYSDDIVNIVKEYILFKRSNNRKVILLCSNITILKAHYSSNGLYSLFSGWKCVDLSKIGKSSVSMPDSDCIIHNSLSESNLQVLKNKIEDDPDWWISRAVIVLLGDGLYFDEEINRLLQLCHSVFYFGNLIEGSVQKISTEELLHGMNIILFENVGTNSEVFSNMLPEVLKLEKTMSIGGGIFPGRERKDEGIVKSLLSRVHLDIHNDYKKIEAPVIRKSDLISRTRDKNEIMMFITDGPFLCSFELVSEPSL